MGIKSVLETAKDLCFAAFAIVAMPRAFQLEAIAAAQAEKNDSSAAVVGATPEIFGLPTVACSGDGSGVALAPEFR